MDATIRVTRVTSHNMSVAYLPSPVRGLWHLGPVPVRAYALCAVAGVVVALWLTDRRYRRMGGPRGMIWDVATVAVPAGIIGSRLYQVLINYGHYLGPGRDWAGIFRIWDGGLGFAGFVAGGAIGAWIFCRRSRFALVPMALAAAPALAAGQAVATLGNWFSQRLYGAPSSWPWAVAISPERRVSGYESFSTFQPVFAYEFLWQVLVVVAVSYAIRRFLLTGDRAFALYAGLQAIGRFAAETLRIDTSPRLLGVRATEILMIAVLAVAAGYLQASRSRRRGQPAGAGPGVPVTVSDSVTDQSAGPAARAGPAADAATETSGVSAVTIP